MKATVLTALSKLDLEAAEGVCAMLRAFCASSGGYRDKAGIAKLSQAVAVTTQRTR